MKTYSDLQAARITAMKNKNADRRAALGLLLNEVQKIAKQDNREPTDEDVLMGANRMVKRAKESLSFMRESDDTTDLETEIAVAAEFLPQQLSESELEAEIDKVLATTERDKKARGAVMRHLSTDYRGQFDAARANEILSERLG